MNTKAAVKWQFDSSAKNHCRRLDDSGPPVFADKGVLHPEGNGQISSPAEKGSLFFVQENRHLAPYSCRHTTATALAITEGIAPQTIKKVMRWSTTRMLDRYAHPTQNDALAAVDTIGTNSQLGSKNGSSQKTNNTHSGTISA